MTPPKIARFLFRITLPKDDRADVLSNVDELYETKRREHGWFTAHAWYWLQAITFSVRIHMAFSSPSRKPASSRQRPERFSQFINDVRYAVRSLFKTPAFTSAAIATLALGVSANTLIFAIVKEVVLQPLPYPEADRLTWVWPSGNLSLTHEQFTTIQPAIRSTAEMTVFAGRAYAILGGGKPDEVSGIAVSTNHFNVFGTQPLLGRGFRAEDGLPGTDRVAVLSYELWQGHFGGDSAIIGRRVDLFTAAAIPMVSGAFTGSQHTIIGIAPRNYRPFGSATQVLTPLIADPNVPAFSNMGELLGVARLQDGVTKEQLQAELVAVTTRIPSLRDFFEQIATAEVIDLHSAMVGSVRPAMFVTLGAVAVVLMIACANVANLSLVRTQARRREIAMRRALGASRGRLIRQLMTESFVLSSFGAILGFLVARAALPVVQRALPHSVGIVSDVRLDGGLLLFCIAILISTSILCGLAPAIRYSHASTDELIRVSNLQSPGKRGHVVNTVLASAQIALALALAYGAALLVTSFNRLTHTQVGFQTANIMTVRVAPSEQRYRDTNLRRSLFDRVLEQTRALPNVRATGAIHFLPVADGGPSIFFLTDPSNPENRMTGGYRVITPGYIETMEIPLVAGRIFEARDDQGSSPVGILNRSMAEQLWPDGDALGRTLFRTSGREWFTVVGVIGDVRQSSRGLPPRPEIYLPLAQSQWASSMTVVARTTDEHAGSGAAITNIIHSEDPNVPVTRTEWMEDIMGQSVASPRFYSVLFSLFAILSLILGGIGVYGVASYVTNLRRDQIGIQLALGATKNRVIRNEVKRGAMPGMIGVAAGVALAVAASRLLTGFLFEMSPVEPLVLTATTLLLASIAVMGVWLPARRAAHLDPMKTLRPE